MATPKRYFINRLPDYNGREFEISKEMWRKHILDVIATCIAKQPLTDRNFDGGLYVGVSGIAFSLLSLSMSETFKPEQKKLLSKAYEIAKFSDEAIHRIPNRRRSDESAFLLGNAGLYALQSAVFYYSGDDENAHRCLKKFLNAGQLSNFAEHGGDEFLVGKAGYIAGSLWLNSIFQKSVVPERKLQELCNSMIDYGRWYAVEHNSPCPLMYSYYDTEYLGAAHGLSSILQMMLSVPSFIDSRPDAERDIKTSVDFLLSIQTSSGNFPTALDELGPRSRPESDELVHWCHGAPGVIYLMAKAYMRWGEQKYLDSCLKCGDVIWNKGLLRKGPGICHGVAGSGYALLLLYRLTQDATHLFRAGQMANFLLSDDFKKARVPDSPFSLYEGLAGTVCFLNHLLNPHLAAFPFMEVF